MDASHTTHAKPGGSRLSPQVQKAREQAKGALRDSGFFGRFSQGRKDASFPVQPERAVVLRSCRIMIMMSESFFCRRRLGLPFRGSNGVPSIQIHERKEIVSLRCRPGETRHQVVAAILGERARALTPLGRLRRSALDKPWRAREYGETSPPCAPPSVGTTLHDSAGLGIPWARARPPSALSAQPPPAHAAHAAQSFAAAAAPACPSPFIPPLGWGGL